MEEDIKVLEERIDYFKCHPEGCNWILSFEDEKDIKALENLIKGYRILEFENQALQNTKDTCPNMATSGIRCDIKSNLIPKSKIKEKIECKIEELFEEMEECNIYDEEGNEEKRQLSDMIVFLKEVLQELMEDK